MRFDVPHFDLCFAGRRVGLTGGLKAVERTLGLRRPDDLAEIDGLQAVRLWRQYTRGSEAALDKLLRYNRQDTTNLARLAPLIYHRLCRDHRGRLAAAGAPAAPRPRPTWARDKPGERDGRD